MVMDENEFNEQLLFYLNELKEFNFEADPKVQKFKKCLEDVIKMEDIKLKILKLTQTKTVKCLKKYLESLTLDLELKKVNL